MARYIDAEELKQERDMAIKAYENANIFTTKAIREHIKPLLDKIVDMPTDDVVEVKHGEWLDNIVEGTTVAGIDFKGVVGYKCSLCGREERKKEPYCNCGAKMGGQ